MRAINRPHVAVTNRGRLRGVDLVVAEALDEGGAPGEASAEKAQHRCGKRMMDMSLGRHWDVIGTSLEILTWREGKLLRVHAQVPDEGGQPRSSEKP